MISANMLRGPRPFPLGDERTHYWRVQRMARATGVDLAEAQRLGVLPQRDWAGMVGRCRGCLWSEDCDHWLDFRAELDNDESEQDALRTCPEDCVNRRTFAALQGELDHGV
ncbi:DUF6455 family protein [Alloyangia pacifica]|uniref:DUF6455 domain-containing protein n=1 Tax=Alloyangia pacifica TaxID=311180 RepID=A0A1I6U8I7_9RHOB|nr:DUF6455 family protein [Alloyangia pacifica]SDH42407.1 hypothetical protein SAMN04488245_107240 [Alloyangia pacifica]SFS97721.1 hypothetical protein SAMN04488050_107240 [Alloyangia pacifica]